MNNDKFVKPNYSVLCGGGFGMLLQAPTPKGKAKENAAE